MKRNKGITLIALVVTIVVLLILAGITINYVMGDNSIFQKAVAAKEKTQTAQAREKIEIALMDWWMQKQTNPDVGLDEFWDKLIDAGIIESDKDVTGPDKDGENDVYIVDTTDGCVVEIIVTPDGEISVGEVVQGDKLPPKVGSITVTTKSSDSISVAVTVRRLEEGKLSYYYKKSDEVTYHELAGKQNTTDLTADFTNLDPDKIYDIKVVVKNKKGTSETVISELTGELRYGTIQQKGITTWSAGKASIELMLKDAESRFKLEYQVNGIDGTWQPYNGPIGNLNHNDTVYARATDGRNEGDVATVEIRDGGAPIVSVAKGSVTTNSITVTASATDAEWGMATSPSYSFFIKKSSDSSYGTAKYTGTNASYTFTGLTQNTNYDVKVTTKDKAENEGAGTSTGIKTGTVGGAGSDLTTGSIIASSPTWSSGKASITLTTSTNLQIQWQKNGISGTWTTVPAGTKTTTVSELNHGDSVYARLYDGTNAGDSAYVAIRDGVDPKATISNLTTSANTGANITATVTHQDNESGPKAAECKWVFTTSATRLGTNASSYTGGTFSSNSQSITWSTTTAGTYYLHVLTVDNAGNKVETVSGAVTVNQLATGITVSPTTASMDEGKTTQLTATVTPAGTKNKSVTWSSSNTGVATVSNTGLVTGVKAGTATITVKTADGSNKSATCSVTVKAVDQIAASWDELNEMAKAIANSSVTSSSTQATVTVNGTSKTIKVGDIYKVRYGTDERRVRVLGFKHDDLVNSGVYGGNHSKASISFEFLDFMTGNTYKQMNSSNTNSGGWANTAMRTFLNGAEGKDKLSNKAYIKQVKKKYIGTYNSASSVATCNDYLWLLAASEVVNNGYNGSGTYGYAITSEGPQYKYYQGVTDAWNSSSTGRQKYNASGSTYWWWLRSPYYHNSSYFCYVYSSGNTVYANHASNYFGVAPGFCI
ncbi:MAG: hypothetical protein HFJ32_02395 [Clostridia bacterium]|nr:hypothetical protein [Clostridia bacterium]